MSVYVKYKQIMYPITEDDIKKIGFNDFEDYWDTFSWNYQENDNFELQLPVAEVNSKWIYNYYLCYILEYEWGANCSDFGRSRFLTPTEQEKYKEIFSKKLKDVDPSKFKLVDFCYYNGCDAPDYYLEEDEFNKEV